MNLPRYIERFIEPRLIESLGDTPVVLVHGPRQCGKTTLVQHVGCARGFTYISFDDDGVLASAQADPVGFIAELPGPVILDEVQRAPEIFTAIKLSVDRDRRPGRFILTGSANVLLLPRLSDSLAGRMAIIRLHPLSRGELAGNQPEFLERLIGEGFACSGGERLGGTIADILAEGGYPEAVGRSSSARRLAWGRDYIETITQRDILELARIRGQDVLPDLLAMAAAQTARTFNLADLAAPFSLSRPTIREYVTLLNKTFMIYQLRSWHANELKRLVKSPKLHFGDTGLACAALGLTADDLRADRKRQGQLLETFVVQEIRRQASWTERPPKLGHYRNRDGVEVDLVVEFGKRRVVAIEVKLAATITAKDFRGIKKLQGALGPRFHKGIVLYDGERPLPFGESLWATPLRCLWE